jgi:nitrogen fixation protein NifU and related proteins
MLWLRASSECGRCSRDVRSTGALPGSHPGAQQGARNYRELVTANHRAEGYNPLCGDHFIVYLDLEGDSIRDISFQGSGCAISTASASMMTQSVKGKTRAEAERLFDQFHKLVTGQSPANGNRAELGKLAVFSGVSEFPVRVKCATLAWHTLHASLEGKQGTVSTE